MKPQTALNHYRVFASEYDKLSKKHDWYSPEILFGLVFEYLNKNKKLLDIGIGTGQSSIPFKKIGINIYGIDGSSKMLEFCKKKNFTKELKLVDLDRENIPYKDNDLISKRIIEKVGVNVFRHKEEYIMDLAKKYNFKLLKKLEYFAYNSPSENKDIYFKAYVFSK